MIQMFFTQVLHNDYLNNFSWKGSVKNQKWFFCVLWKPAFATLSFKSVPLITFVKYLPKLRMNIHFSFVAF